MKYAQKFCGRVAACALLSVLLGCFVLQIVQALGQAPLSPANPSAAHAAAQASVVQPPVGRAPEQPLSADDVSWLFPAPTKESDLVNLIAMSDLTVPNPQDPTKRDRVWSDAAFQRFITIAESSAGSVTDSDKIGLSDAAKKIDAWHIAGVRFDAGAPGLSDAIIEEYGQSPQIRLIVQPVIREADGTVTAVDTTAHLIFSFAKQELLPPSKLGCFPRPVPDLVAFKQIVAEVAALRSKLRDGELGDNKIVTAEKALGIHPGLVDQTTASNVRAEMKAILERHLSPERLGQMAIMALPANDAPEPWIFLAMQFVPPQLLPPPEAAQMPKGGFVPVPNPTLDGKQFAQLLRPEGANPRVVPKPRTNNLVPITCINAAAERADLPLQRTGVATADLPTGIQKTAAGKAKVLSELNTIADPNRSHFFNTDCVSCHTETRRALELLLPADIPKIAAAPLPNGPWNVRNFGWSPLSEGDVGGTVSRRTATETKAVVDFINAKLLN